MAESLLNIKNRIEAVESIKKITKVMKLIASSKYTKLKTLYDSNSEYTKQLKYTMNLCLKYIDFSSYKLPTCLSQNLGDKKLFIYVTSTLGLCGSYFYNLEKIAEKEIKEGDDVIFIGEKGYRSFKNRVNEVYIDYLHILDHLTFENVNEFRHYMDKLYRDKGYSSIYIIYTKYIDALNTKTVCEKLLPLELSEEEVTNSEPLFEGSSDRVADLIVPHYLDALIYRYFLESSLCEQVNRKNSMENATTSANKLLYDLGLLYNKVRQQKITEEMTEVTSGGCNLNF